MNKIYQIPLDWIVQLQAIRVINTNLSLPVSIDCDCPTCKRRVNFNQNVKTFDETSNIVINLGTCPACRTVSKFIIIGPSKHAGTNPECILIYPSLEIKKELLNGYDLLPEKLLRAYQSAINIYNTSEWNGTVTACRRSLEGILKLKLPPEVTKSTLYNQLKDLPTHLNLAEPITQLADIIRDGGNLGAHFDLDKEADGEIAKEIISYLEYILEYIFILPEKIKKLRTMLDGENDEGSTQETE